MLDLQGSWQVAPLPPRMQDRRVDVGDVSPDDALSMVLALNSGAQVRAQDGQTAAGQRYVVTF